MKTILFHVNSFLTGGIEKILLEILHGLNPEKYRIKLSIAYYMGNRELLKHEIPSYVEINYLLEHPLLTTPHKKKKTAHTHFLEKALAELILPPIKKTIKRKKIKQLLNDVDVVIDFDTTLAPFHKLFSNKRSIAYCHFDLNNMWKGRKKKLDKLANRLLHYNTIVMLCEEMKEDASAKYPSLAPKLTKLYNALNLQKIRTLANERIDLPQDFIDNGYLISVGRLHEAQKDFTTLVKAYGRAVNDYGIKERLVIVGKGSAKEELRKIAKELGVQNRVLFTDHQDNPYKWMRQAKLFLFSSKYEGLPTVLIEAHALGLPIVATATPTGVKELVMDGKAGTLVPIGDVEAMANAIHTLLHNDDLQNSYLQNAQKLLKQFSIEYMIPQLEKLF